MKEPQLLHPQMLLAGDVGLNGRGEVLIESFTGAARWNGLALFSDREQLAEAKTHLQRNIPRSYEKFRSWIVGEATAAEAVQLCLMSLRP